MKSENCMFEIDSHCINIDIMEKSGMIMTRQNKKAGTKYYNCIGCHMYKMKPKSK